MKTLSRALFLLAIVQPGCSGDGVDADGDADADSDADSDADADADSDGDADADADADGDCDPPDAPPDLPARAQVRVVHETRPGSQGTTLSAQFWASDPPVPHRETLREGDCRLLEYEPQECPDGCWDGICQDGECIPYPLLQSAGTVRITGLPNDATLQYMSGNYYAYSEDPALAGAVLHASGTGDEAAAFDVEATVPVAIDPEIDDDQIDLADGADFTLRWAPADRCGARVRLQVKSNNAAHGLPVNAMIECDVPDTGSLAIASSLIEAFPPAVRAKICAGTDCPMSTITRYSRATTAGGALELRIEDVVTFYVVHQ